MPAPVRVLRRAAHGAVTEEQTIHDIWRGEPHPREVLLLDNDFFGAWGALPYPMPYTRSPELLGYARWVLGGFDKSVPWTEWVAANYEPRRLRLRDRGAQVSVDFTARRLPVLEEERCLT
jgi:hypothetical protein